jgi:hypothetical protein
MFGATLLIAACGGTPVATTSSAPSATTVNHLTASCSDSSPCVLAAGTWVTAGDNAFIPGLAVTLPDGWSSHGVEIGELDLIPTDHPADAIFLWKDVAAIESNGETPKVLNDVPRTPEGLTASFRKNPDLVVSTPTETTIAGGIPALTYVIGVSPSAAYTSRGCPSYPTCANILTDPVHFEPDRFYAIGAPGVVRLYLATVGTATDRHTFVIGLDATDPTELERFSVVAAPIIASIRLPAIIGSQ